MASQERHHVFWRAEQHALNAAMMAFADARMSASVAAEAEAEAEPCTASGAESASATPLTPFVTADTAAADTALCTFFRAHQAARAPAFRAYNTDLYRDRFALLAPGFRADAARIKRWASSALRSSSSTLSRPLSPAAASAPTSPAAAWAATTWLIREFGGFIGLSLAPRGRAQGISVR
ncbi:hypothetical protein CAUPRSCDRAFT_12425 [Caulochytrium protostelioides]|uniref:Uncharacterized protein n=1 Tax=Caulochytrium protostelioides TaxID=1555241 RepID=A0A4P9WX81_9FUNG|nr:hypothetical protein CAUPRSCDRAFT_12425 [Caulochytrium protostelioides]